MPSNFEQLVFEIIATDRNASAAFDRFRQKVDQTSSSVDKNTSTLDKNAKSFENVGKKTEDAGSILSSFSAPGGGMGLLIGAGAALAPVLATVGTGLAGFGAAAYGSIAPIEKAAQKTGGLQKNMALLNPEQRKLAESLLGLGKQYDAFQKQLQPQVLSVFGKGVKLAGELLHDVQPVAAATGKAIGGLLDQIDAEFKSGTWQQFFGFMAATAGPDIKLLGDSFTHLMGTLPPLLESLQPLSFELLKDVSAITRLTQLTAQGTLATEHAARGQSILGQAIHNAVQQMAPEIQFAPKLRDWLLRTTDAASSNAVAQAQLNERLKGTHAATADLLHPLGSFTGGLATAKAATDNEKAAVTTLSTALKVLGAGLLTTEADQVAWRQAQQAATKAIDQNKHSLDSNRGSALAARQAIIASTQSALAFANQEVNVHHNTDAASRVLQAQISWLRQHAGHSKVATDEIDALQRALNKLSRMPDIRESIYMTGRGTWGIFGKNPVNSGLFNAAEGGRVPGYGGGDRWPYLLEGGEAIVPKHLTPAVAPFLKAQGVPGFAQGGIIPSYTGSPSGMAAWAGHDWNASLRLISNSMAAGIQRAVKGALSSFAGFGVAGPGGGAPAANAALARRMMPAWGSGAEWAAWNYVAMRESGWSQFARNPSSGAYGIPQALPPGKMGPAANPPMSNPAAQISWMIGYIRSRYGDPIGAAAHERAFNWYDQGGWLPPGLSLAYNGTGAPERVGGGNTYQITVNVPPSANKAEVGRAIIECVVEAEKRSGSGWRRG